jgi:oxygen-independent coproporphyrinogen-3 oxidase
VDRVLREYQQRSAMLGTTPTTLFLGGGTPSRLPADLLAPLLGGLGPWVAQAEVSAEVNPEDATTPWLEAALAAGINRVSLGVQTFDPQRAKLLGRAHTSPMAVDALRRIASTGFASWSADLMFAVPDQTLADLDSDLDQLLALDPPHVSLYGLTFEPSTPFEARRQAGKMTPLADGLWRDMYDHLVARLEAAGLTRYEVSNFGRPGHASAHNQHYWRGSPYLGLGPGAHGLASSGLRWVNLADPAAWMASEDPTAHQEQPSPREASMDLLLSGMRCVVGVDLNALACALDGAVLDRLQEQGLLQRFEGRIALTHHAFPIADAVVIRLVEALEA